MNQVPGEQSCKQGKRTVSFLLVADTNQYPPKRASVADTNQYPPKRAPVADTNQYPPKWVLEADMGVRLFLF